jgi:hypothetical protein
MRLVGTSEWIVIGVLIAYVAFTPGFPVVRQFLSTGLGKAIGLAVIVAVWKYVSHPVALLLLVNFVRCSGMREGMENPEPPSPCPDGYSLVDGQCKNTTTGQSIPMAPPASPSAAVTPPPPPPASSPPPPAMPPPPSTSTSEIRQPFSNMTPAPVPGGVVPDLKEKENFAPF